MAAAPQPGPAVRQPSSPPSPILAAWPRSAQWTTAFLLGVVVTLLGSQALSFLRWGTRPSDLERTVVPAYRVDLNSASREELLQLPGVGDHMATRIEDFRREKGRIRHVDDLQEVHGVGPATMNRLRDWIQVEEGEEDDLEPPLGISTSTKKKAPTSAKSSGSKSADPNKPVDINRASLDQLVQLPGIGMTTAQRIVEERKKKPFESVDDLKRVPRLKGKTLDKLRPYITVGSSSRDVAKNQEN